MPPKGYKRDPLTGKFVKGNESGSMKHKREQDEKEAATWNDALDIKARLRQLDEIVFKYLSGEITLSRDQVQVLNKTMDIYSSKEIPNAKPIETEDSDKIVDVVIGLPPMPEVDDES